MDGTSVCHLPAADRAQRAAQFRALFAGRLLDRVRVPGGVRWTLRAGGTTASESRRLASLEARCCDGIAFDVSGVGDEVVWVISGPPSADATLDALFELPRLVQNEAGAAQLWQMLDAASCGPRTRE